MKKNFDHREINRKLEIFLFDEKIGQGLPILLKNGTIIKNIIQNVLRKKEAENYCIEVISPVLANPLLYKISGHSDHYEEYIFPKIQKENESFQLRPMTCPHHCIIYSRKINSYKEMPIWISEHSILHRFEPSGSLRGIERSRWMEISDNHIFTTYSDLKNSFKKSFLFVSEILSCFDIKISRYVCSLHEPNNKKYHDKREIWNYSESILIESLKELKINFIEKQGEAAFYGPKLDIEVENSEGKNITISTIQIDFILPEKFLLSYVNKDGSKSTPVIIHYSSIGTYQRFISVIVEQNKGKLPVWLCPLQIVLLPSKINNSVLEFCERINNILILEGKRSEVWKESKRVSQKIRKVYDLSIPFYLVLGNKEIESGVASIYNTRSNKNHEIFLSELSFFLDRAQERKIN